MAIATKKQSMAAHFNVLRDIMHLLRLGFVIIITPWILITFWRVKTSTSTGHIGICEESLCCCEKYYSIRSR